MGDDGLHGETVADDRLRAVARTAEMLADQLRDLVAQTGLDETRARETAERLRELELRDETLSARWRLIAGAVAESPGLDDVRSMADLLAALADKPNDLLVMVKLAEESGRLSAIVDALLRIKAIVEQTEPTIS